MNQKHTDTEEGGETTGTKKNKNGGKHHSWSRDIKHTVRTVWGTAAGMDRWIDVCLVHRRGVAWARGQLDSARVQTQLKFWLPSSAMLHIKLLLTLAPFECHQMDVIHSRLYKGRASWEEIVGEIFLCCIPAEDSWMEGEGAEKKGAKRAGGRDVGVRQSRRHKQSKCLQLC